MTFSRWQFLNERPNFELPFSVNYLRFRAAMWTILDFIWIMLKCHSDWYWTLLGWTREWGLWELWLLRPMECLNFAIKVPPRLFGRVFLRLIYFGGAITNVHVREVFRYLYVLVLCLPCPILFWPNTNTICWCSWFQIYICIDKK